MAIANELYTQAREIINDAQSVLICVNNRSSYDTHLAAVAMYKYLSAEKKSISIATNGDLQLRNQNLFDKEGMTVDAGVKPLSYVVAIDHSEGGIDKVSYDDKDGKFFLYITPAQDAKPFDFDQVEFSQGGGEVDAIIVFGARTLRWMNEAYEDNKDLFERLPVISINDIPGEQEYGTVQLVDTESSVSGAVYELLKGMNSASLKGNTADLLLAGVLDRIELPQVSDYQISDIEHVASLVKAGADIKMAYQNLYLDKTLENFEVQRRVMNNIKSDPESEIIWSSVSNYDLSQCGVDRESFILDGRIIFNTSTVFRLAFVLYEVEEGEVLVEMESNSREIDAKDVMGEIKAGGNEARVFCTIRDKTLAEVEQLMLELASSALGKGTVAPVSAAVELNKPRSNKEDESKPPLVEGDMDDENGSLEAPPVEETPTDDGMVMPPPVMPEG